MASALRDRETLVKHAQTAGFVLRATGELLRRRGKVFQKHRCYDLARVRSVYDGITNVSYLVLLHSTLDPVEVGFRSRLQASTLGSYCGSACDPRTGSLGRRCGRTLVESGRVKV
eukprot:190187-Prorocentrum_minimum.AAC.1